MKKIVISVLALLLLTGCSNNSSDQTLFVANKKDQYGLVDIDGNKKTKFIYDRYEPMAKDGYIVVKDDKYGYLSYEGEEIIKLGKYQKLESISNMIVAYDKDDNISILSSLGEVLYKTDDKTEIVLSGLPIIHQGKKYLVLYDTGKVLVEGKSEILNANIIKDGYMAVAYEDNIKIYNQENLNREVKVKTGGKFQLMSQSEDNGYLFYDREGQKALFCDEKGKIIFDVNIELDDLYFDQDGNITGVKNQTTYLFDKKGVATAINSYYNDLENYVIKNREMIYGPHKFVYNGKETNVSGIQLDPMASYISSKIFPVYVRSKGYMYYGYDGKPAFKTLFTSAEIFDQNGLAVVSKKDDKYYLINQKGKKISKTYSRISYIGEKYYAGFISDSKYEIIDTEGKKVIDDNFMDDGIVFTYNDNVYGIFNKSGSSYVYDMNELEVIFFVEDTLEFVDNGYFTSESGNYYTLDGEEIYKR